MAVARAERACARSTALAFVLALACALPASAQTGSGLYEPFPEPAAQSQAQDYLEQLLLRPVSAQELDEGRFLRGLAPAPENARPATKRAGSGANTTTRLDAPTALILLLTATGGGAALVAARRASSRTPE